jgi:hypothetical protein
MSILQMLRLMEKELRLYGGNPMNLFCIQRTWMEQELTW